MKTVTVKIEGISPILLHSSIGMVRMSAKKKTIPTPEEEAKKGCYFLPDEKTLGFPTVNFVQSILKVGRSVKVGKKYVGPYLAGCVVPAEEMASFNTKEYDIDTRRVVVQRQGILRSRAKLPSWALTFQLAVDEKNLLDGFGVDDLPGIISEAGTRVGIGDYRPEKGGPYGRFKLVSFQVC